MLKLITGSIFLLGILYIAADTIYQCQDNNGTMIYTNKPLKNATKVNLPPISVYSSPMTKNDYNAKGYTPEVTNNKPLKLVNQLNASSRSEISRKQILNEELMHEQQALSDAQQALQTAQHMTLVSEKNDPQQYQARLHILQDSVTEHQKNIAILSQQLIN